MLSLKSGLWQVKASYYNATEHNKDINGIIINMQFKEIQKNMKRENK